MLSDKVDLKNRILKRKITIINYLLTLAEIVKELQGDCDTAFVNLAVDCGACTLDIMSVVNKVPLLDECHTYQIGLITTIDHIQKDCIAKFDKEIPEYHQIYIGI